MDRFIVEFSDNEFNLNSDLKSNMDRFIVLLVIMFEEKTYI